MLESDYRIYDLNKKNFWGPKYWSVLYITVLGFPVSLEEEKIREFRHLLSVFHLFLPCLECRYNYQKEIRKPEILALMDSMETKDDAFDITIIRDIIQIPGVKTEI